MEPCTLGGTPQCRQVAYLLACDATAKQVCCLVGDVVLGSLLGKQGQLNGAAMQPCGIVAKGTAFVMRLYC